MLIIFILLISIIISSSKVFYKCGTRFYPGYISKEQTQTIEGLFVFLVCIRHFFQYITPKETLDVLGKTADSYLGQLIVVPFLFYTGYGTMTQIRNKGTEYVKSLPVRFFKLLIRFDICVFLLWCVNQLMGVHHPYRKILLSFVGWESIGNSNWYIFCICCFYINVYFSFLLAGKNSYVSVCLVTAFTIVYIFVMTNAGGKKGAWINTSPVLPLGMWFSLYKEKIEKYLSRYSFLYYGAFAAAAFILGYVHQYRSTRLRFYLIYSCFFAIVLVLTTMKVQFRNNFLYFLGSHVFSIYILQRIPFRIIRKYFPMKPAINYFLVSFVVTIVIAVLFDHVWQSAEKKISSKITR